MHLAALHHASRKPAWWKNMHMGVGRIFSRGASRGFSQFFFQEGPNVVKFVFYPSNLKKKTLLLIISKSMGANAPPFRRPWICILCKKTSPKLWFGNMNMTSNCDVANSPYKIQITIMCHWMKPPTKIFCVRHWSREWQAWHMPWAPLWGGGAQKLLGKIKIFVDSFFNLYFAPHAFIYCKAASTPRPHLKHYVGRVALAPLSIMTKLRYCDITQGSDIATVQARTLACHVHQCCQLIYTVYIYFFSKCLAYKFLIWYIWEIWYIFVRV